MCDFTEYLVHPVQEWSPRANDCFAILSMAITSSLFSSLHFCATIAILSSVNAITNSANVHD